MKHQQLSIEEFSIGRLPSNNLHVHDQRLSGKHCVIAKTVDQNGLCKIECTDFSSNGTFVNGAIVM